MECSKMQPIKCHLVSITINIEKWGVHFQDLLKCHPLFKLKFTSNFSYNFIIAFKNFSVWDALRTLPCVFILTFFGRQMFSKHQYLLKRLVEIVEKYWHLEVTCSFEDFICWLWHLESFGNGHLIWSPSVECFVIDIFSRSCVQEMLQDEESCNSKNLVDWFWLGLLKFMLN